MCRYAMSRYKDHYACFECRKAYKKPHLLDLPQQPKDGEQRVVLCPQCRLQMNNMGLDFKAPAQRDVEQWTKVKKLFEMGVAFHSCGCDGPGRRPATLRDIKPFFAEQHRRETEEARERAVAARAAALKAKRKKASAARLNKQIRAEALTHERRDARSKSFG